MINIAELLKDCPTGMELDCSIYENVTLVQVKEGYDYPIVIETPNGQMLLSKYGCFSKNELAKCIIFPKGETTWEGFHKPFADGDIVAYGGDSFTDQLQIFIFKDKKENNTLSNCYLMLDVDRDELYLDDGMYYVTRFATEEEQNKLFDAIKAKGYKWNEETKTLEKLEQTWTIQYAKDGDVLAFDDETIVIFKDLYNNTSFHSYCHIEDGIFTISKEDMPDWWRTKGFYPATEEQKAKLFDAIKKHGYKWNADSKTLDELPKPKFKVDNKIKLKGGDEIGYITQVTDCCYTIKCKNNTHCWPIERQDAWELVPDIKPKFKVGDEIVKRNSINSSWIVSSVSSEYYGLKSPKGSECIGVMSIAEQDEYELVQTKFDITTLKPFKSEVLVRNYKSDYWKPAIFGFTEKDKNAPFYVVGGNFYYKCIPYEGNEHLLGTTDDCDDYYKL
jgi:hypothetical protein